MMGRPAAPATRRKCSTAISGRCPIVKGPGGKTSKALAPPSAAILAIRAASRLPSAYTPCTIGSRSPISSFAIARTRFCSSNVHEATSVECALTVIPERPSTEATSRRCARKDGSSIDRSSWKGKSTAGTTPWGIHFVSRAIVTPLLDPEIVIPDHLRPLLRLGARKGQELLRRAPDDVEPLSGQLAAYFRIGERLPRFRVEARDDLLRRSGGHEHPHPGFRGEPGHGLGAGRAIPELGGGGGASHRTQ